MKKEFIEKVLKEKEVITKKYRYVARPDEHVSGITYVVRYDENGHIIDCVYVDMPEDISDIHFEDLEKSTNPFDFENKDSEDYSLLDERGLVNRTAQALDHMGRNFLEVSALMYVAKEKILKGEPMWIDGIISYNTNIYEYGKANFGFARGTVSDYIGIAERFLIKNNNSGVSVPVPLLKKEYSEYSVSKLQALLPIKEDEWIRAHCNPSMTVREIKALVKEWKASDKIETDIQEDCTDTEDSDLDNLTLCINKDTQKKEVKHLKLIKEYNFNSFDEYNKDLDEIDTKISNLLKSGKTIRFIISEIY